MCEDSLILTHLNDNVVEPIGSETGRRDYKAKRGLGDEPSEWQPGEGEQQLQQPLYTLLQLFEHFSGQVNSSAIHKMFAINIQPEYG